MTAGNAVNVKTAIPYAEESVGASLESAPMIAIFALKSREASWCGDVRIGWMASLPGKRIEPVVKE